ncbi:MAG TPA: D-isomer specific 2-hydroxyacid dehydrogenase family protein [Rhodoglobus sp.]|nr:D-isomer specific 2-hydroxyacid dehydrogenase family protein [Rhodoglobus sp.]
MTRRTPGEHRDLVAPSAAPLTRPQPGPIAILPEPRASFVAAVESAGGVVAPLSDETRGLIWLAPTETPELVDLLQSHPGIGWVQLPWAGVDAFASTLKRFAGSSSPLWTSAKGSYSEPVAEHALALTLAVLRGLPEKARATSWAPVKVGTSLYGRHVLVVGAGGIAIEVMRLFAPFEVEFTIVRRSADPLPGAQRTVPVADLLSVLPDADVVILAAAATDETAQLIGATELAAMKANAALINIARGALVDQEALLASLNSGHLAGAGIDVTDPEPLPDGHPLWQAPRCIVTGHTADTPEMTEPLLAERVRRNVEALLGDGRFVGVVDPAAGY